MAATPEDIKSFFNLIGKTVTTQHLLKVQEALATQRYGTDAAGNPRTPTADDLIDWIWRTTRAFINRRTEIQAKQAVEIPQEDLLDE